MTTVLVVDDDFMVAKVHSGFVGRLPGFTVVGQAHTGGDALDAAARLQPDLLLLDVYLPDMTGLQVLQKLRAAPGAESQAEVLMVTAAKDAETVRTALRGGASGYLIKPFTFDDLRVRLEHLVEARRRLDELPEGEQARQEDVDRLFVTAAPSAPAPPPPKGLSPETVTLVRSVLRDVGDAGLSATECAERTGLSRVSARRYLEHLAQTGQAGVRARYGGTGRPERRFRAV